MPLWNRLKHELDRAGKVAQDAIDEGKVRLEAFRARQLADKAAQALGYAVYRARKEGREIEPDTYTRLSRTLEGHEREASRHEATLEELARTRRARGRAPDAPDAGPPPPTGPSAVTPYEPPPARTSDEATPPL